MFECKGSFIVLSQGNRKIYIEFLCHIILLKYGKIDKDIKIKSD
jgi:hypothetical protein